MTDQIAYAICPTRTIFLDLTRGRYFCLEPERDQAFRDFMQTDQAGSAPDVLMPLFERGFQLPAATTATVGAPIIYPKPSVEREQTAPFRILLWFLLPCILWSLVEARRTIRLGGFRLVIHTVSNWSVRPSARSAHDAGALIHAFEASRRYLPWKKTCLLDAFALMRFLRLFGVRAALVIGVSDQPFAAHCWLQSGATVLNDSLERVQNFAPIVAWEA